MPASVLQLIADLRTYLQARHSTQRAAGLLAVVHCISAEHAVGGAA